MDELREYPVPVASDEEVAAFIARYGTPYDPETDDYHRDPFVAEIREGKNDPIYNAHSYHTKVPPRAIIPYILHYTEPGDIILDPFCGSGMTGVAALMCENPPEDVLQAVPGAEKGARRAILNDLSPAACHIAYNYCTPVDVEALKAESERIKAAVKEEFNWLYGTEHYEPAVGLYEPTKPEVACHLKNPPLDAPQNGLISVVDREWELIDRSEVERRMGPEALAKQPLPGGVEQFICIPAMIHYTIWSDLYSCGGTITVEEPTGKVDTRTRLPCLKKVRRPRGCGAVFSLWDVAIDATTGAVRPRFECSNCQQSWVKTQLKRCGFAPVVTNYSYRGLKLRRRGKGTVIGDATVRTERPVYQFEKARLSSSKKLVRDFSVLRSFKMWADGPQYRRNALRGRGIQTAADFFTDRNHAGLALLYREIIRAPQHLRPSLLFCLTAICPSMSRMYIFRESRKGSILKGSLYFPSLFQEMNVYAAFFSKESDVLALAGRKRPEQATPAVMWGSSTTLLSNLSECIDYIFTDPPFGSNLYYSEAGCLFDAWLNKRMDRILEAVVHRREDGGMKTLADYGGLMTASFRRMYELLKPGRFLTVEFNNSDGQVFEAIKNAVREVGFAIENMVFLDKVHKTFKQKKGDKGEEDVAGHDVLFNLRKPSKGRALSSDHEEVGLDVQTSSLEDLVSEVIREHLRTLPQSIQKDSTIYSDEHRTTPFLNTMLMNTLIPRGVDVSRLNLPFIDRVCARYFRKVDGRWYLRDETVGDNGPSSNKGRLFQIPDENVSIEDEKSAIAWLRQTLTTTPMRIGELRPHWMKATVKLTGDLSIQLERLLRENFWLDRSTRRWRIPTADELGELNDHERQRACHDAERFLEGKLSPHPTDAEILGWIEKLYSAVGRLEEEAIGLVEPGEEPTLPADLVAYYRMMPRLLQSVLKENVDASAYTRASRQCRTAARKIQEHDDRKEAEAQSRSGPRQGKLFD